MFKCSLLATLLLIASNAFSDPGWRTSELLNTPEEICTLSQPREAYAFLRAFIEQSNFNECERAARDYNFWLCMAECQALEAGENVGGGCAHRVLTNGICSLPPADTSHCQVFRQFPELSLREEAAITINRFCVENGYDELQFR